MSFSDVPLVGQYTVVQDVEWDDSRSGGQIALFDVDGSPYLPAKADYVQQQVDDALSRWAELGKRMTYVSDISSPWQASNPSVVMSPDGVVFGPYSDGAATGGSIRFHGLDGSPFSIIQNVAWNSRYDSDDKKLEGSALYFRVWMNDSSGNEHDAIFTPGSQDYPGLGPGPFEEHVATSGTWRYDSDDGSGGVPLADIQAQYGDQLITKMALTLGWTAGTNLRALLRWMQINGNRFTFGS